MIESTHNSEGVCYIRFMDGIFKYIVAKYFFKDYAPNVKSWNKKLSGKNSNGNPVTFTEADMNEIESGLKEFFKEYHKQSKKDDADVRLKNRQLLQFVKKVTVSLGNGGYSPEEEFGRLYEEGEKLLKKVKKPK